MKLVFKRDQVALLSFAVHRMIQDGHQMIHHSTLKGSAVTAEQAKLLERDVVELEAVKLYLATELQKEEA